MEAHGPSQAYLKDEVLQAKRQAGPVEVKREKLKKDSGIKSFEEFVCRENPEAGIGWTEMYDELRNTNILQTGIKRLFLHTAFKAALEKQLMLLQKGKETGKKAMLYHGVCNIGKSSLSIATAHFLALALGEACLVTFSSKDSKSTVEPKYTEQVLEETVIKLSPKAVVLDQANLVDKNPTSFLFLKTDGSSWKVPFTIFTSGHYEPEEIWLQNNIYYKIIDIAVTKYDTTRMIRFECEGEPNQEECEALWDLSRNYGTLKEIAMYRHKGVDGLLEKRYDSLNRESTVRLFKYFWILWPTFMRKNRDKTFPDQQPTDFVISPEKMLYISQDLNREKVKDTTIEPTSLFLTWLACAQFNKENMVHIKSNQNGYTEIEYSDHFYYIFNSETFNKMLRMAMEKFTLKDALPCFLDTYHVLDEESNSHSQFILGGLFENVLTSYAESKLSGYLFDKDYLVHKEYVELHDGVSTVKDLVAWLVKRSEPGSTHTPYKTWFILNTHGRPPFKGFDFAYVDYVQYPDQKTSIKEFQLFDACINPDSKKKIDQKQKKVDVLKAIHTELNETGLYEFELLKPFLLMPRDKVEQSFSIQLDVNGTLLDLPFVCMDPKQKEFKL